MCAGHIPSWNFQPINVTGVTMLIREPVCVGEICCMQVANRSLVIEVMSFQVQTKDASKN